MKKLLSGILSGALVAAAFAIPSLAQMAKKAVSPTAKAEKSAMVKAVSQKATALVECQPGFDLLQKGQSRKSLGVKNPFAQATNRGTFFAGPMKEEAQIPQICGCVVYSDFWTTTAKIGLYNLPVASPYDPTLIFEGPKANYGGVCLDGKYYSTTANFNDQNQVTAILTQIHDMATGERLKLIQNTTLSVMSPAGYALDPTTNKVYGITYDSEGYPRQLSTLEFTDDAVNVTAVATMQGSWSAIAFDSNGQLYGLVKLGSGTTVTNTGLYKIDKETGTFTAVGSTGIVPKYTSGATIDTKTNRMFWNVCPADEYGYMYEVDLATGAATLLYQLSGSEDIFGLFVPAVEEEDPGTIVPPYTSDYAANGLVGWTILDNNNDGNTWTVNNNEVRVRWNSSMAMDDYLITPAIKLESGKAYNLKFTARANGTSFTERIEVLFGKEATAAGLTQTLVEPTDLTSSEAREFSVMLTPSETGLYYVGFHGISDADKYYLNLGNISISAGVSALAPGAATDLVVTPDANGALKANVSFKAPATTMGGQTLTGNMTKVEVLRSDNVVKTFTNVAPGQACSFDDNLSVGGNTTYTVVGYNSYGEGLQATATAFIGFNKPADMGALKLVNGSVPGQAVLSWDAVTTDVNGLTYPAGAVTYKVCEYNDEDELVTVAENITDTSYTFQAVEAGKQDFIERAVFAVYDGMQGKGMAAFEPIGTPYNGIAESFPGKSLNYIWGLSSLGGQLYLVNDEDFGDVTSQDADNGFLAFYGQYAGLGVQLFSGLVSLAQIENPALTFYTYNIVGDELDGNEITVYVKEEGQDEWTTIMGPKTVDTLCDGQEGWGRVSVPLGAYAGKTIQFKIEGITVIYLYTMIDNISVHSSVAYDLAATSITAPSKVKPGEDYTVEVKVANLGGQDATNFTVELYADGELASSEAVASLESGSTLNVEFERTMSPIAMEPVTYYAKVVFGADEDTENNQTSNVTVAPVVSALPAVSDLEGECKSNGVSLTWSEPDVQAGGPITEDFENADSFASSYGSWKFVDLDGATVGGFQNMEIPGITSFESTGSFWIWDQSQLGNETFAAHSGSKYLFALFNADGQNGPVIQNNDWAISPELNGAAQTISFWARSYGAQYPESVSVYYSTGSLQPTDFVKINGAGSTAVPGEWTEFTADLPAGAKYFAIVCDSNDKFMLMVDDVTFTPAEGAELEIAGYNVYRDGVKINDALVEETSYLDTNVENNVQYTYVVTVVYNVKGESAPSNEVVVTVTGLGVNTVGDGAVAIQAVGNDIVVLNAEGLEVTVASVDGAVVYNGLGDAKTVVTVGKGVYVVTAGKKVKKVLVK